MGKEPLRPDFIIFQGTVNMYVFISELETIENWFIIPEKILTMVQTVPIWANNRDYLEESCAMELYTKKNNCNGQFINGDLEYVTKICELIKSPHTGNTLQATVYRFENAIICVCSPAGSDIAPYQLKGYINSRFSPGSNPEYYKQILIDRNRIWEKHDLTPDEESVLLVVDDVILRKYVCGIRDQYIHNGTVAKALVMFWEKESSISISIKSKIEGFDVTEFCREQWGPDAGGCGGIVSSPLGKVLYRTDAVCVTEHLACTLRRIQENQTEK